MPATEATASHEVRIVDGQILVRLGHLDEMGPHSDVYAAGESPEPGITGKLVADAAADAGAGDVAYVPNRADLAAHVAGSVAAGDLVLLLGAGDVTAVAEELAELLDARP